MIKMYVCKSDTVVFFQDIIYNYPQILKGTSMLQIGGRGESCTSLFDLFIRRGYKKTDLLEVWEPNVEKLKNSRSISSIYLGDVRNFDKIITSNYDIVFWSHGPEHILEHEFRTILPTILSKCGVFLVGCPDGVYEQGPIHGNPFEVHVKHWLPEELESLGFDVYLFREDKKIPNTMLGIQIGRQMSA